MKKHALNLLLVAFLAVLASCDNTSHRYSIDFGVIEALMSLRLDNELAILEVVEDKESLSRRDKAPYYPLWTEAQDKNYLTHTTDSLITISTDYYEETDDLKRKAKAWYYKRRINQDLEHALSSSMCTHASTLEYLSGVKEKQFVWQDYVLLCKKYGLYRDSIDKLTEIESIRKMDFLYNYQKVQEELHLSRLEVMKKDKECWLYALFACVCILLSFILHFYWQEREKIVRKQKSILEQTIEKQRLKNQLIMEENARKIAELQARISSVEKEGQGHQGSQFLNERRGLSGIVQMRESVIYQKFHTEDYIKLTSDDWGELEKLLNENYDNFTVRLRELYPKISYMEMQVCCLTKLGLRSTVITRMLCYNSSPLRSRLYRKLLNKDGNIFDFNSFISDF